MARRDLLIPKSRLERLCELLSERERGDGSPVDAARRYGDAATLGAIEELGVDLGISADEAVSLAMEHGLGKVSAKIRRAAVSSNDAVLRAVSLDRNEALCAEGRAWMLSSAISFSSDPRPSVYLESKLAPRGLDARDVIRSRTERKGVEENIMVFCAEVSDIRAIGFEVEYTPARVEPASEVDVAHAEIVHTDAAVAAARRYEEALLQAFRPAVAGPDGLLLS